MCLWAIEELTLGKVMVAGLYLYGSWFTSPKTVVELESVVGER